MKTYQRQDILGRDGETKEEMLGWFIRRGFDIEQSGLRNLNARQLDILAGYVTHYHLHDTDPCDPSLHPDEEYRDDQ